MKLSKKNVFIWLGVAVLLVVGLFLVVPEVMAQDKGAGDGLATVDAGAATGGEAAKKAATDSAETTSSPGDTGNGTDSGTDADAAGTGAAAGNGGGGQGATGGSGNGSSGNGSNGDSGNNGTGVNGGGSTGNGSGNNGTGVNGGNSGTGTGTGTGNGGNSGGGNGATTTTKTCYLAIDCATILNNRSQLNPAKAGYVPADGWIMSRRPVTFTEGESVFDILKREVQGSGIHMEFVFTPMYNSAYIEGINNLYEFDCGELSGWMYKVNGWYPNYGCSLYYPQDGDVIEWRYTCDLGQDVGGGWAVTG